MPDQSFQISHPSDMNGQIRGLHEKMLFSDNRLRFRGCFDLFIGHCFQRTTPGRPILVLA
jgi:hypothetical protein